MQLEPRPGLHHLARQGAPEDLLHVERGGAQQLEVDPGLDAELVQQVDQVLGADVAGGAGRERAAAEPGEGGFVDVDALGEAGRSR